MTDGQIKGNGNSRYLRTIPNALDAYPTYEEFMTALIQGQFPIDLAGINVQGWVTQGDKLNKATLLTDTAANALGLTGSKLPTQAFEKLRQLVNTAQSTANNKLLCFSSSYTGSDTPEKTLYTPAKYANVKLGIITIGSSPASGGTPYATAVIFAKNSPVKYGSNLQYNRVSFAANGTAAEVHLGDASDNSAIYPFNSFSKYYNVAVLYSD